MSHRTKLRLAAFAAGTVATGASLVLGAPAANAEPQPTIDCVKYWTDTTGAERVIKPHSPVHAGPDKTCRTRWKPDFYSTVSLDCWVVNGRGKIWWHVRANHYATAGWVWEGNFRDAPVAGPRRHC